MIKKKIVNCRYELKFDYYVTDDGRVWSDIGQEFNVHPDTIGRIKHKHYWKEVLDQLS